MSLILGNIVACLGRCTSLRTFKQIHAHELVKGLSHGNYEAVQLVSFCSKILGDIFYARSIFDNYINSANVFLWTTMITCYTNHQSELTRQAILVFKLMHKHGPRSNDFTLSSVLKACSFLKSIWEGNQIYAHTMKLGYNSSIYVQNTLLDMYAKFECIKEARHLFGIMPDKNVVACNAMIACYLKKNNNEAAREIFDNMLDRDSISWNFMISGYSDIGDWHESLKLFNDLLLDCVKPNHVTLTLVMSACGHLGALKLARQFHAMLHKLCIEMNDYAFNSLVDMYAKCGSIHEAYRVFSESSIKDVVSYNVMIAGFANHGHGEDAIKLFPEMIEGGIQPDTVTFLGILTACSQSGLLDIGRWYFASMSRYYAVVPSVDHYACMVDLFGRAGFVDEAYDLVKSMQVEPHAGVWGALLNACKTHRHIEVGKIAARELFEIEPENPGNYVLLSNIYAQAGLWDGVSEVRRLMRGRSLAKTVGCSWIEVNSRVDEFLMGDATHPLLEEISEILRHLLLQTVYDQFTSDVPDFDMDGV